MLYIKQKTMLSGDLHSGQQNNSVNENSATVLYCTVL